MSCVIVAVMVANPEPATLNLVPLFVRNTMVGLSVTYENVPLLFEVGDSVNGASIIVLIRFERPDIDGVARLTINENVFVPIS